MTFRHILLFTMLLFGMGQVQADVKTLSAGVGVEDRFSRDAYSLKLVFFIKTGPYLANIKVRIFDLQGNLVLEQTSVGPWFYADLPKGRYGVVAERENGERESALFTLDREGQREVALAFAP